jgi:hypothetical protein
MIAVLYNTGSRYSIVKMTSIGLTIHTLSRDSEERQIREVTREIMQLIDTAIITANDRGVHHIEYELPRHLADIANMSTKNIQLRVYSDLLRMYKTPVDEGGKGFETAHILIPATKVPYLCIKWNPKMDDRDVATRRRFLMKNTIRIAK